MKLIWDHWPADPPRHLFKPLQLLNFDYDAVLGPDPAFHSNADPDPASQNNVDLSGSGILAVPVRYLSLTASILRKWFQKVLVVGQRVCPMLK